MRVVFRLRWVWSYPSCTEVKFWSTHQPSHKTTCNENWAGIELNYFASIHRLSLDRICLAKSFIKEEHRMMHLFYNKVGTCGCKIVINNFTRCNRSCLKRKVALDHGTTGEFLVGAERWILFGTPRRSSSVWNSSRPSSLLYCVCDPISSYNTCGWCAFQIEFWEVGMVVRNHVLVD